MSVLDWLMGAAPAGGVGDVAGWWAGHQGLVARFEDPGELAAAGGFAADRLGWAFASGYHGALCRLRPDARRDERVALCATEDKGAHPRHIHTTLRPADGGFLLNGRKGFVTLGTEAERFLVVASEGELDGRNRLRVVVIDRRPGLTIEALPTLPFVPEIPHAALHLKDVRVAADEVLPGDGYVSLLKPFRTIEDLHVHAALLGYLIRVGRSSGWPADRIEAALTLLASVLHLAGADPSSAATHRTLGGILAAARDLVESLDPLWASTDPEVAARWERDRPLLKIAGSARAARLSRARATAAAAGAS